VIWSAVVTPLMVPLSRPRSATVRPLTASLNTTVTVVLSPTVRVLSATLRLVTVGALVSTAKADELAELVFWLSKMSDTAEDLMLTTLLAASTSALGV